MVYNKPQADAGELENGYSTESCDETAANNLGYGLTESCGHVKSIDLPKIRKAIKTTGILQSCQQCDKEPSSTTTTLTMMDNDLEVSIEYDETLWIW